MVSDIQGLILDMDGVLWKGEQPIGNLQSIFKQITDDNLKVVLATNNASRSVEQYLDKLNSFGVNLEHRQIITSGIATGHYLQQRFPKGGSIYVVGEAALADTLAEFKFIHSPHEDHVTAVIAALDRGITYGKLKRACKLIRSGAEYIGTNPDPTFPEPDGLAPGAGAIIAFIQKATDVDPAIIGKPAPTMYTLALERLGTAPENTLVIGDRLETDIAGAQSLNCYCGLVLSGVTTSKELLHWSPQPDYIASDLSELINMI